jgi:23S rRNA pseudouridine2605 synthase
VSEPGDPIRLQRYLAQAGVASRRQSEEVIAAGRVRVNGAVVTALGTRVRPGKDRVEVDGQRVWPQELTYLLLNKPAGYVTTLGDPEGRPSVRDLLPTDGPRLFPVGRLDFASEGALLCTNDGDLAHALAHPSKQVPKRYLARVRGEVDDPTVERLSRGVELEDGRTAPAKVLVQAETSSHTWLDLTVTEGRNRLIRRMCEACGLPVMRLIRTHFAGLQTEPLRPGAFRSLTAKEVARLRKTAGLPHRRVQPRPPRSKEGKGKPGAPKTPRGKGTGAPTRGKGTGAPTRGKGTGAPTRGKPKARGSRSDAPAGTPEKGSGVSKGPGRKRKQ